MTNKKKLFVILILISSTGCSGDDPYDLQQEISDLRQSISADKIAMGYKQIDCKYGKSNHVVEGKKALAEWDGAIAENIDNVTPERELEIRRSIGKEMGLPASEINNWREVMKGRALTSQHEADRAEANSKRIAANSEYHRQIACDDVTLASTEIAEKEKQLATLKNRFNDLRSQ